jgi:hypothetical protein
LMQQKFCIQCSSINKHCTKELNYQVEMEWPFKFIPNMD